MKSEKNAGRIVGVLLVLHLAVGLIVPFVMLQPLVSPPGFLTSAAGVANQTRTAVLLLFMGSAVAIAIASAGWRVFREYSSAMALWLFALAVASFTLQAVDNAHILSMLSLSQTYAQAGTAKAEVFQALALVVGSGSTRDDRRGATDRGRQFARTAGISAGNAAGHAVGAGLRAGGGVADGQRVRGTAAAVECGRRLRTGRTDAVKAIERAWQGEVQMNENRSLVITSLHLVFLLLAFTYGILQVPSLVNSLFAGRSGESVVPRING